MSWSCIKNREQSRDCADEKICGQRRYFKVSKEGGGDEFSWGEIGDLSRPGSGDRKEESVISRDKRKTTLLGSNMGSFISPH